ncbi:MAG: tRNA glutamyl-Q(34) synthetase GluQRS [Kiritimatiellia bacterium]
MPKPYTGRLAPSPTGALHLGNVRTFMIAWLRARAQGGRVIYRTEDLDHPRDRPGAARAARDDLEWLGFDWDETFVQSERKELYREALERLKSQGRVYPCVCSRKDVQAAQSAPHAGEQLYYPGMCRNRFSAWADAAAVRPPCWRFRVGEGEIVRFTDVFAGPYALDVSNALGDFPIARDEFGAGYTLAVVVDDALMGVTEVVRADDLLAATPCQILLYRALGYEPPAFCHVPLVVGPDGRRLCKRHGDTRIASYRAAGVAPETILGRLAQTCGWGDGSPRSLRELLPLFALETIPSEKVVWTDGGPLRSA